MLARSVGVCAYNPGVQGEASGESLAQGKPQLHSKDSLNHTVQPCLKKPKDGGVEQW